MCMTRKSWVWLGARWGLGPGFQRGHLNWIFLGFGHWFCLGEPHIPPVRWAGWLLLLPWGHYHGFAYLQHFITYLPTFVPYLTVDPAVTRSPIRLVYLHHFELD